jgi:glutamyl-Q tRNA(Asp) synthetase
MAFVTRFAPSPTGYLHLGHAFSALQAFDAAQAAGGRFLLRIEDIDAGRRRPEFEAAIYEDLAWLGLTWETPVRRQSEHLADYLAALDRLIARGVVYRCFRTRKEILAASLNAPHGAEDLAPGGPAPDEAELLAAGRPFAWRLSLARARAHLGSVCDELKVEADGLRVKAQLERLGDAVLARKDFPASYHLASVCDDALQGITDVIRGEDLREAAHLHVLLQALLGLAHPRYRHHRLILGPNGKRLAKRDQAQTLRELRRSGRTPTDIRALLNA